MRKLKQIAYELSKGNIEKASRIRLSFHFEDKLLELEVTEIAQQAIISYLKKGEYEKATRAKTLFSLSEELSNEAVKQAIISSYYDGDLRRVIDIKDNFPVRMNVLEEMVNYCESWGRHGEAKAMQGLFLEENGKSSF